MDVTDPRDPPVGHRRCRWCREPTMAEAVAAFFVAQADPAYISHSELQFGRAVAPGRWADDLATIIRGEARRAIARAIEEDGLSGTRLAVLTDGGALRGLAFVSFNRTARHPFATLDDLLVEATARGEGLGQMLSDWIVRQCQTAGLTRIFLESGAGNGQAHHFFERQGFVQTSVVMMRAL